MKKILVTILLLLFSFGGYASAIDYSTGTTLFYTKTISLSDEDRTFYENYIRQNINTLSPVSPVLGGTWYVTKIVWGDNGGVTVYYEDGHISETLTLNVFELCHPPIADDNPPICTLQYAPVCAEVQVQCIRAPCPPVQETFGNACMAGNNPILYKGECSNYIDAASYKKYLEKTDLVKNAIDDIPVNTLKRLSNRLQLLIDNTKLMNIAFSIQQGRITKYFFLKQVIDEEIMNRM